MMHDDTRLPKTGDSRRRKANSTHNGQHTSIIYVILSSNTTKERQDRHGTCTVRPALRGASGYHPLLRGRLFASCGCSTPRTTHSKETKMPSKKQRIIMYLTPEEHTQISESAARAGISRSTFAKRVCISKGETA